MSLQPTLDDEMELSYLQERNHLLRSLPWDDYVRLNEQCELVTLPITTPVYTPTEPLEHVYFPQSGLISIVSSTDEHATVEVAMVGNEGFVGVSLLLGAHTIIDTGLSQVLVRTKRMPVQAFKEELAGTPVLYNLLLQYTQTLFGQIAQSMACTRSHSIDERCARWLLMAHDRVGEDCFFLTHEFLAEMLAARRPSVTTAASALAKAGFISYRRGRVNILDRVGLETASCRCYSLISCSYDSILGVPRRMVSVS